MAEKKDPITLYAEAKGITRAQAITDLEGINKGFTSLYETGDFSLISEDESSAHRGLAASFKSDPLLLRAFDTFRKSRGEDGVQETLASANNTWGISDPIRKIGDYFTGGDTQESFEKALYEPYGFTKSGTGSWTPPYQEKQAAKADTEIFNKMAPVTDEDVAESESKTQEPKVDLDNPQKPATQSQAEPQTTPAPAQEVQPAPEDTRGLFTLQENLGNVDPAAKSLQARQLRNAKNNALAAANQSLKIDTRNALQQKKNRQKTLDFENDIAQAWASSPTGRRSGKSFYELDPEQQDMMRNRFVDFRMGLAGPSANSSAPQANPTRQNISQEDFDNMSDADLERELTGVRGGAYESPRIKLEDLTVPQAQGLGQGINNQINALERASAMDPNNQEIKDSLNAFKNTQFEQPTPPAPTVTPSPDDFQIEPQGTGYDGSRDLAAVRNSVMKKAPANLDMPYNIPQETTFEPQVRPPQYDRAKDLSMVQKQTSMDTPAMPKPEFITRENNAPAPAPAPAMEEPAAPISKTPKPKYIPRYGSQGFIGFNEGSSKGRFIQAPKGQDRKTMLSNLMRQDNEDEENRKKYANNNPFGTEFRPAAREYLGPIEKSPTPRTTAMMREYDAMPKSQQMGVINSFRKKRGEEELYNPFA